MTDNAQDNKSLGPNGGGPSPMPARSRTSYFFSILLMSLVLFVREAPAYDETGHHPVVYAMAIEAGYSSEQAALIADASQSLDENLSTTAYDPALIWNEAKGSNVNAAIKGDIPHMVSGQIFHALSSLENRSQIERAHLDRINGMPPGDERMRLIYLGEYLHFVADEVVHPTDPLWGHFAQKEAPDYGERDAAKLRVMMYLVKDKLVQSRQGSISVSGLEDFRRAPEAPQDANIEKIADTIEKLWTPRKSREFEHAVKEGEFGHENADKLDHLKAEIASIEIGKIIGETRPIRLHKIEMDENGNPLDRPLQENESPSKFREALASSTALKEERREAVRHAGHIAEDFAFESEESKQVFYHAGASLRTMTYLLPVGPGGIALDPGLKLPQGLGRPLKITVDEVGLALETSKGSYHLAGMDPQGFATILRGMTEGQIPFITIGSEPSDRDGYAKVTYSPALSGTWEGSLLYRADVQFKALFAQYPLGDAYQLNVPGDALMSGFPGIGGDSSRLWITSEGIRLKEEGGRLVMADAGMRINSETAMRGETVRDQALEQYARRLTAHWDEIAGELPEFRAVEGLALDTALAFWVRNNQVQVEPLIWLIPPRFAHTPEYSPLLVSVSGGMGLAGGVSLAPEQKSRAPGRDLLFKISQVLYQKEQDSRWPMLLRLLFAAFAAFWIGAILAAFAAMFRALLPRGRSGAFKERLRLSAKALSAQGLLAALTAPLVFGRGLSAFDRDFIAFIATLGASGFVLYFILKGDAKYQAARWQRLPFILTSLLLPILTGIAGEQLAWLTVSCVGVVPSRPVETLLTAELAPLNTLCAAAMTGLLGGTGKDALLPIPWSLVKAMSAPWEFEARRFESPPDRLNLSGKKNPLFPFETLEKVKWPEGMPLTPDVFYYSIDGRLPYDSPNTKEESP